MERNVYNGMEIGLSPPSTVVPDSALAIGVD